MGNYDHRIAGYFALAMLQVGIKPQEVKRVVAMAQIKMDNMTPDEAWKEAVEELKKGGKR